MPINMKWCEWRLVPLLCYFLIAQLSWSWFLSLKPKNALYSLHLCFHEASHAKPLLCFIPVRVRMGRAPCTWQLSMGGSRGHRPSSRTVSFCASGVALQDIRHIHCWIFSSSAPEGSSMNFWLWAELTALIPLCRRYLGFWLLIKFHDLPADSGPDDLFRFLTWKQEFRGVFRSFFCWDRCTIF